jgi:predicted HTH domain antitoxin
VRTLAIEYPEALLATWGASGESFEKEARLALAMKLFELGRITSGQAAAIAGLSRAAFLMSGERFGTPAVSWDADEIRREFDLGIE